MSAKTFLLLLQLYIYKLGVNTGLGDSVMPYSVGKAAKKREEYQKCKEGGNIF
jgi:hypothetical protein